MVDETIEVVRQVPVLGQKWVITDETEQKIVMGKYERAVRELEKKWHRCKDDKKLVMDMMWGQLDDDTQAQMELVPSYAKVRKDGDIVAFLKLLRDICNGSDDGGLSYHPFKVVAAIKALCNYTNSDVSNPHLYKKELKTKYYATKAICGDFPLGTKILLHVLQTPALGGNLRNTLSVYHGWTPDVQANWIRRYDDLALAMLFLNNSKNEDAKKELRRSFANGNKSAYQDTLEKMARLLSSQYPMTKGQNKKNTPNDGGKSKRKGGGNDANRDEENSGTPLAGAHTIDDDNAKKTTSSSTSANTAGAHISDSEECDPPTSSRSVQQLLASHPVDSPFWGDQDRTDDYSVDTDDSAQHLVGVHAYDVPPNDAERILAHAMHLCPQVCRYVWFHLRQLSAVTRREGATLAPLSPEESRRRVCTRNCRQMWQQMADEAAQQGTFFPPMRNGIPDFHAVAERGAHVAQNLLGFHACDQQDCEEDKEILTMEEEREEARLMTLDQQLLGSDTHDDGPEDLDEETARLIAVEWISTADPDDKSDLLQNMDNLDVAVLITSNMDCDLKGKIPQEPDFRIGQHRN